MIAKPKASLGNRKPGGGCLPSAGLTFRSVLLPLHYGLKLRWILVTIGIFAALVAQETPPTPGDSPAGPGAAEPPPQEKTRPVPAANAGEVPVEPKPETGSDLVPEETAGPKGSGTALPYDFLLPGASAAPPDLTLASSRPFTLGLGPSAFGPGIRSSVNAGVLYDDNIFQNDANPVEDLVLSGGVRIQAELGSADRGLALSYAINGYAYVDHPDQNTINHDVGLSVYRRWGRTQVSLDVGYDHSTGSDRDLGTTGGLGNASTTRDSAAASLSIFQGVGARARISAGVDYTSDYYDTYDSTNISGRLGFDHQVGRYSRVGIQGVLGSLNGDDSGQIQDTTSQSGSLDQTFEQINGTFDYHATDRLNTTGSVGWEWRHTDGGETQGGFVYDLNLHYRLGRATVVTARGSRHTVGAASYSNVDRRSTNFELSVTQPVGRRYVLNVAGGYELSDYGGVQGDLGSGRQDTFVYFRPSLSVALASRLSMSLFYEFRKNDSSGADGITYQGNRVGMQLTYSF